MFLSISIKAWILSCLNHTVMSKSLHFLTSCDVGMGRELSGVSRWDQTLILALQEMQKGQASNLQGFLLLPAENWVYFYDELPIRKPQSEHWYSRLLWLLRVCGINWLWIQGVPFVTLVCWKEKLGSLFLWCRLQNPLFKMLTVFLLKPSSAVVSTVCPYSGIWAPCNWESLFVQ